MSKAVLMSIQPKWCELIASGEKTVEVRKTKPKLETPFKVYIYCTKAKNFFTHGCIRDTLDDLYRLPSGELKFGYSGELMCYSIDEYNEDNFLNGKVIGEFVCDEVIDARDIVGDEFYKKTCLTYEDWRRYTDGTKNTIWLLHIYDLVIYGKSKELSEFRLYNCRVEFENGYPIPTHTIKRPPQSWCYVEEREKNG